MSEFTYKEVDVEGMDTLEVVASADKFNEWMYNTIRPFCTGRILEIGSGIGNISQFFLDNKANLTLSDIRENYCAILENKFKNFPNLAGVVRLDLVDPGFDETYASLLGTFDSVFALNVVEHIQDDARAIQNCRKLLKAGGTLVVLVPAYQWLYNNFDRKLEHYRRYTAQSLRKASGSGWQIISQRYFNAMGMLGWFVSGKLMKNETIPSQQMKIYNLVVPIAQVIDALVLRKTGLSLIQVSKKNAQ